MHTHQPDRYTEFTPCIDALIEQVGKDLHVALPLGLGKPIEFVNALYARARRDPSIQLTFLTALSLEKPLPSSDLEARFMQPFVERVWGNCPDLQYAVDATNGKLPPNVRVKEFFFKPGSRLQHPQAQMDYISTNYTMAARDVFLQGCNVAVQLVCKPADGDSHRLSLSCNPDTSVELIRLLKDSKRTHRVIGVVNQQLPYMVHDAEVPVELFDAIVDNPRFYSTLFSTPKLPVGVVDYALGLHVAALIRDGGTLQVGIGALGDAVVYATLLRHQKPAVFKAALSVLGQTAAQRTLADAVGGFEPFEHGLYGATEMLVDGFMELYKAGILKREVYTHAALQAVVHQGACPKGSIPPDILDHLNRHGLREITPFQFRQLQFHGVFKPNLKHEGVHVVLEGGERVLANLADRQARRVLAQHLGSRLLNGVVLHAGFFLGPRSLYQFLHDLPDVERARIAMTGVEHVNQLDLNPTLYRAQRVHARFVNTGVMVTSNGAVVSDGLADGRVISGVGGQYNFVAMAQQLDTGRSILMIRAVRDKEGKTAEPSSNVVFNYGHCTIPRHLRDIVVTEYGVADLRGKTDEEVAKALLNITDSRFQPTLLAQLKAAGKVHTSYHIPAEHQHNTPERLAQALSPFIHKGLFPAMPFGTDLTPMELNLAHALKGIKRVADATPAWKLALKALVYRHAGKEFDEELARMQLDKPRSLKDRVVRMLLIEQLKLSRT
ncbi:acetyl-CoA hydrolase [Limnobacter humi]|uniref:Acetyl-CoA hydrolase n=1 Tax=Limnobacter humi TaxID=1778671 RepID=A0ABT1WF36_9BURK|nr:acetyl-CoA hydrolase/transferase C-terminal domain-containing protein [Limnobacter humi]MCQ8895508.1 acetyl-CoA hydrolase [Limnobacter humi]